MGSLHLRVRMKLVFRSARTSAVTSAILAELTRLMETTVAATWRMEVPSARGVNGGNEGKGGEQGGRGGDEGGGEGGGGEGGGEGGGRVGGGGSVGGGGRVGGRGGGKSESSRRKPVLKSDPLDVAARFKTITATRCGRARGTGGMPQNCEQDRRTLNQST